MAHSRRLTRRQFLESAALATGAVALQRQDSRAEQLRGDALPDPKHSGIDHIVVAMMENRSFDHMMGWLPGADGRQAGLPDVDRAGWNTPPTRSRPTIRAAAIQTPIIHTRVPGSSTTTAHVTAGCAPATTTSIPSATTRLAMCRSSAQRHQIGPRAIGISPRSWARRSKPYLSACGSDRPAEQHVRNQHAAHDMGPPCRGRPDRSLLLSDLPVSRALGRKVCRNSGHISRFCWTARPGAYRRYRSSIRASYRNHRHDQRDHPHADIRNGQAYLNGIYTAVTRSPAWRRTLLVINYDEWGGFFEHVPP